MEEDLEISVESTPAGWLIAHVTYFDETIIADDSCGSWLISLDGDKPAREASVVRELVPWAAAGVQKVVKQMRRAGELPTE